MIKITKKILIFTLLLTFFESFCAKHGIKKGISSKPQVQSKIIKDPAIAPIVKKSDFPKIEWGDIIREEEKKTTSQFQMIGRYMRFAAYFCGVIAVTYFTLNGNVSRCYNTIKHGFISGMKKPQTLFIKIKEKTTEIWRFVREYGEPPASAVMLSAKEDIPNGSKPVELQETQVYSRSSNTNILKFATPVVIFLASSFSLMMKTLG